MAQIIMAANQTEVMSARVSVSDWCRSDMFWWKQALPVYSLRTCLMDPDRRPGPLAVVSHTDAAGGSRRSFGKGVGMTKVEDIPFKNVKISGLMTKTKPNGSVRPILNFSRGNPTSLNDGIDSKDFPTKMSSTEEWVRVLIRCGKGARFCKNDWASK